MPRSPIEFWFDFSSGDAYFAAATIDGLAFQPPENHPITALPASRAYYWVEERAPQAAHDFARAAFHAYFTEARDMPVPANVAAVGTALGLLTAELEAGISSEPMKARVRTVTDEAIAKGVFGSPFFLVDGDPFWGWDRMPMLEAWLKTGGW